MPDRPIIFSGPMVRALLDGRKTQTRRVLGNSGRRNGQSNIFNADIGWSDSYVMDPGNAWWRDRYTPYATGDRLYVREHWRCEARFDHLAPRNIPNDIPIYFAADTDPSDSEPGCAGRFRQGRHMPRWASRLTLTVTDVRVQRLQEISAADSIAEGIQCETCAAMGQSACHGAGCFASLVAFRVLWNSLHGPEAWDANPWVAAATFTVQHGNIDQIGGGS